MKRTASILTAAVLGVCLAAPSVAVDAQGRGEAKGQSKAAKSNDKPQKVKSEKPAKAEKPDKAPKPAKAAKDADIVVVDRDGHTRVIREYRGAGALPPGLAKRQSLPPGLQRQLVERGELPPGLRTYLVDVPSPWARRLPAVPSYYHRYFVGDDLVILDTRTDRVVAIVRDVLR